MKYSWLWLVLLLSSAAAAQEAAQHLREQLSGLVSLHGRFTQQQYSELGTALQRSAGTFRLLRPDQFLWSIESPDSQLLIASGDRLWHYDRDLETATRRRVGAQLDQSPLQILSGNVEALRRHYTVVTLAPSADHPQASGFRLTPRHDAAAFEWLELYVAKGVPLSMSFIDMLGQKTHIEFSDLQVNSGVSSADFDFQPPPGTDILYDD